MKLIEINWNPTARQLRQFAIISIVAIPLIVALWTRGNWGAALWALGGTALVGGAGIAFPPLIKPIFVLASLVTAPIGLVIGEIAMFTIYSLVFVPLAFAFKLMQRDALRRHVVSGTDSYWHTKTRATDAKSYYKQS